MVSDFNLEKTKNDLVRQAGILAIVMLVNVASAYALTVPDVRGTWTGTVTGNEQGCQDPDDNGSYSFNGFLTIDVQNGQQFSGFTSGGESSTFTCTILPDNSFTCMGNYAGPGYSGIESSSGSVTGNTFTAVNMFQDTVGDTCNGTENISATRLGAIPPPIVIPNPFPSPSQTHPGSDLDGDGKADIVWRNTSSGVVAVWLMNGTTIVASAFLDGVPSEWEIVGVGDLNADGMADVIWRNRTSGVVAVWLMNGLTITSVGFPGSTSTDWEIEQIGDVDGNGTADLVWRNQSSGVVAVWLMNGATISASGFLGGVPAEWEIAGIGDVDGNGTADVIWRNGTTGTVAVWQVNSLTIMSVGFPGSTSTDWEIVGVGDVNADGMADLIWRNSTTRQLALWVMNGTAIGSSGFLTGKSLEWQLAQVGDTDGDDKADMIWHNRNTGEVEVWRMDGMSLSATGFPGSTSTDWEISSGGRCIGQHCESETDTPNEDADIQIKKIWSDQLEGVVANFLPGGAGEDGNRDHVILMGVREDNKAYVKAEYSINNPALKDKVLLSLGLIENHLRCKDKSQASIVPVGDASVLENIASLHTSLDGEKVKNESVDVLPFPLPQPQYPVPNDYVVVAGIDKNEDFKLQQDEISVTSSGCFRIVSKSVYQTVFDFLNIGRISQMSDLPNGTEFLRVFLFDATEVSLRDRINYPSAPINIGDIKNQHPLDYNVGVGFKGQDNGIIRNFFFPANSSLADDIRNSTTFHETLEHTLNLNKEEVVNFFKSSPQNDHEFEWPIRHKIKENEQKINEMLFDKDKDFDMFVTFGKVILNGSIKVIVRRNGSDLITDSVSVQGLAVDLYDSDWGDMPSLGRLLVIVQAGYNSLKNFLGTANGGHVFRSHVTLDGDKVFPFNFGSTSIEISGNWFAQETVTANCTLAGEQETITQSGSGIITIRQNGQQVSYIPPGGTSDLIRTGQVTSNSVQFSGKFLFPVEGIDINFTQNTATATGPIAHNRIDLTGTGIARGTVVGFGQLECTGNSTATFTR